MVRVPLAPDHQGYGRWTVQEREVTDFQRADATTFAFTDSGGSTVPRERGRVAMQEGRATPRRDPAYGD
jgi:hypothetical protein